MLLLVVTITMTLFQIWWGSAYLYAYRQTRERLLLLQVVQGFAFALLFGSAAFAILNNQPVSNPLSTALLVVGLITFVIWRFRGGIRWLFQRYPRGMFDVLLFRKPTVNLKRRVRSK